METVISRHQHVATSARFLPDAPPAQITSLVPEMQELYEAGDVLIFPHHHLEASPKDWQFLRQINLSACADNAIKKAKLSSLLAPIRNESYGSHVLARIAGKHPQSGRTMQDIIIRVQKQLEGYVRAWFPRYKIIGSNITWRFTLTEAEEMHYDSYGEDDSEKHYVRLFVNLDTQPRLWGVGPPVDWAIRTYRDRCRPHRGLHPNRFNRSLNAALPWEEIPRHFAAFAPGAMWLVNSQIVAHEAIYGRKLVACTFNVDPASMLSPERSFPNVVRAALAQHLGA